MPVHCTSCGAEAAPQAAFCHRCGTALGAGASKAAFGKPADATAPASSPRARISSGPVESEPESELWSGSYCWKHMIGSWALSFLVTVTLVVGTWFLVRVERLAPHSVTIWLVVLGVIALIWVYLLLQLLYRQLTISYRLTSELLTIQRGILSVTFDRLELIDIDDITVEQGITDRMLGIGTIVIRSSDTSDPVLPLIGIDDVQSVAELLDKARRKKRAKAMKVEQI